MKDLKYGGNMYLILLYDIRKEGNYAKRQRRTFNTCKKYLNHIQNSVFEGQLDRSQYMELSLALKGILNKDLDSCIAFSSRNNVWMQKEFITKPLEEDDQFI